MRYVRVNAESYQLCKLCKGKKIWVKLGLKVIDVPRRANIHGKMIPKTHGCHPERPSERLSSAAWYVKGVFWLSSNPGRDFCSYFNTIT